MKEEKFEKAIQTQVLQKGLESAKIICGLFLKKQQRN